MKTRNPIRFTVTNFVTAKGRRRKSEYKKLTFSDFFNDLENRGPLKPNSVFERWTKKIHKDMLKKKTWIKEGEGVNLTFVQEYISRLQAEFWRLNNDCIKYNKKNYTSSMFTFIYNSFHRLEHVETFEIIYKKIRTIGLRMKWFLLCKFVRKSVGKTHVIEYDYGKNAKHCRYLISYCDKGMIFLIKPFGLVSIFWEDSSRYSSFVR